MTPGFLVAKPGLQTTLQDWPGRIGYWRVGIPPSGPMDSLSFRIANRLVGNVPGATALEFQFIGPKLECLNKPVSLAIVGGEVRADIDGEPVPASTVVVIRPGQVLNCGNLVTGARAYLAVSGGFAKDGLLGSTATFPRGGIGGEALKAGEKLHLAAPSTANAGNYLAEDIGLVDGSDPVPVEVTAGPHFNWLSPRGHEILLDSAWSVSSRSDRTGVRLDGPELDFAARATNKAPENGTDPSNVINTGYPVGGVNICGNTPIILPVDGPSQGGFITPIVVTSSALRKVGQLRPNQKLRFLRVSLEEAIAARNDADRLATNFRVGSAS